MGCPPEGSPNSRDQAAVPNWAGDFSAIMKLAIRHRCYPQLSDVLAYMKRNEAIEEDAYRHVLLTMLDAKIKRENEQSENQDQLDSHATN